MFKALADEIAVLQRIPQGMLAILIPSQRLCGRVILETIEMASLWRAQSRPELIAQMLDYLFLSRIWRRGRLSTLDRDCFGEAFAK